MAVRSIKVLDAAALARRNVVVLELDTPNPIIGVALGMSVMMIFRNGARATVDLKQLGFASSTPDHAHIIVTAPGIEHDLATLERIELETRA